MLSLNKIEAQAIAYTQRLMASLTKRALQFVRNPSIDLVQSFDVKLANLIAENQALMHISAVDHVMSKVIRFNANTGLNVSDVKDRYMSDALRIARHTTDTIESSLRARIADGQLKGKPRSQIVDEVSKAMNQFGIPGFTKGQVETLVTTHLITAKSAGEWNTYASMQDVLWGFRYLTAGDDAVRDSHAAVDGVTLPFDDEFWQVWYPPNGYNCRCEVIPLFKSERQKTPPTDVQPDRDFSFNPGQGYRTRIQGSITRPEFDLKVRPKPLTSAQVNRVSSVPTETSGPVTYEKVLDRGIANSRLSKKSIVYAEVNATDYNFNALKPGVRVTLNKHLVTKNRLGDPTTPTVLRVETKSGDVGATLDDVTLLLSGKRPYRLKSHHKRKGVNIITLIQE